jgi:hypothetical protein
MEAFMRNGLLWRTAACTLVLLLVSVTGALAKIPEGYRDVKLGMKKSEVVELLQKSPLHMSYDDLEGQIGEIIRGDDLFRYATYRFNRENVLVEIGLEMREILGRDRVLEVFNTQNGLALTPLQRTIESGRSVEVQDNSLVLRLDLGKDTRAAKGAP